MLEKSVGMPVAITALLLSACGPVSGSDPSLWQPAQGFAGAQAGLIPNPNMGAAGFGGAPIGASGAGNPLPPPPNGAGGNQSFGGTPTFGGSPNPGGSPGFAGVPVTGTGGDLGGAGFTGSTGGAPVFGNGGAPQPQPTTTGTSPPPPPGMNSGTCTFTFNVTTTPTGGTFSPKNVGAIYILNSGGTFVKSLNLWGGIRLGNLTDWEQGSSGNKTDAVTGATRNNEGPISGNWNCTDTSHQPVADGQYQVCTSLQESDALPFFGPAPKKGCVNFSKGSGPVSQTPPDQGNFTHMSLTLQ